MKKINFIVAIIGLVGQLLGFVGIFISKSNDQLMISLVTFLAYSTLGALALIFNGKENDKINTKKVW